MTGVREASAVADRHRARLIFALHHAAPGINADIGKVVSASQVAGAGGLSQPLADLERRLKQLHQRIAKETGAHGRDAKIRTLTLGALREFAVAVSTLRQANAASDPVARFRLFGQGFRQVDQARSRQAASERALGAKWRF